MAIVRELLVKIGFVTDKKDVREANNTITKFKSRFTLMSAAAIYAGRKVVSVFSNVATSILDSERAARKLGISLRNLLSGQKAAGQFRISSDQFLAALTESKAIIESQEKLFRTGNKLRVNFDPKGDPEKTFLTILEGLRTLDKTARDIAAEEIFPGMGIEISDLAKDLNIFLQNREKFLQTQPTTDLETFKKFELAIADLRESFNNFILEISDDLIPVMRDLFYFFSETVKLMINGFKFWKEFFQDVKSFLSAIPQGIKSFLSPMTEEEFKKKQDAYKNRTEDQPEFDYSSFLGFPTGTKMQPNITVNNTNNIEVPPGTEAETASNIAESVNSSIIKAIEDSWYNVQRNNPRYE